MRSTIVAGLAFLLAACARDPARPAQVAEVPMYSTSEWVAMNSESTVPEIPDNDIVPPYVEGPFHVHWHGPRHGGGFSMHVRSLH
jgi:hypothetical protein